MCPSRLSCPSRSRVASWQTGTAGVQFHAGESVNRRARQHHRCGKDVEHDGLLVPTFLARSFRTSHSVPPRYLDRHLTALYSMYFYMTSQRLLSCEGHVAGIAGKALAVDIGTKRLRAKSGF